MKAYPSHQFTSMADGSGDMVPPNDVPMDHASLVDHIEVYVLPLDE